MHAFIRPMRTVGVLRLVGGVVRARVDHVVLVTSPTHMRRSLATFRAEGITAIPAIACTQPAKFTPNEDTRRVTRLSRAT